MFQCWWFGPYLVARHEMYLSRRRPGSLGRWIPSWKTSWSWRRNLQPMPIWMLPEQRRFPAAAPVRSGTTGWWWTNGNRWWWQSDFGIFLGELQAFIAQLRLSFWLEQNARDLMTEQFKMDEMHQLVANDMPVTLMMPGWHYDFRPLWYYGKSWPRRPWSWRHIQDPSAA